MGTDENGTNEMATPEMISKAVVQSNVPDEKNEDDETEIEEIEDENEIRKEYQNDIIGAKYLQVEKSVYFMDYEIFSLEVPVKDHKKPVVIEAKDSEIEMG